MQTRDAYCTFCRKSHLDVGVLIEGPNGVHICRECIVLFQKIIDHEQRRRNSPHGDSEPAPLCGKLDQLVSGQDEAKHALTTAVSLRNDGGGRALLIGPNLSTMLFLARAVAHSLDAPFAAGGANSLVRSKRGSLEVIPLLLDLLQASDFDVSAAERGVVFVEGVEQLTAQVALSRLWQGELQPLEGTPLDVSKILFVCGGKFVGLDNAIAGLGRHTEQPVAVDALAAVGADSGWATCLTVIARVAPLNEVELGRIMHWVDFRRCEPEQSLTIGSTEPE